MQALLRPVVEAEGFDLYDVSRRREGGRTVLQVMVERPGGVEIDGLAHLSRRISQHLDARGSQTEPFDLRVTSPGLERPLSRPEHFRRSVGEQVKLKTSAQVEGSRIHTGTLMAAGDEECILEADGAELHVPYSGISSARRVVDWSVELKGSNT